MHNDPQRDEPLGQALERAIATLREPVSLSPEFDECVMSRVLDAGPPVVDGSHAMRVGLTVARFPLGRLRLLAMAAGLAIVALGVTLAIRQVGGAVHTPSLPMVRFTIVAPGARSVAVVGDFNHWNATASPLRRARPGGATWAATVRMTPGRHIYSFLVDGKQWVVDAHAPRSLDDDFGRPSAVVTVAGHST